MLGRRPHDVNQFPSVELLNCFEHKRFFFNLTLSSFPEKSNLIFPSLAREGTEMTILSSTELDTGLEA